MPIELASPITVLSQDEYHEVDRLMMHHAFKIHNRFGRLLNEGIYKDELADCCSSAGMSAQREVIVRVRHGDFLKDYRIDLLLAGSTVVEAKTATVIVDAHRSQGINYLFLTDTYHGSLVNFRTGSVIREFLSTTLNLERRRRFEVESHAWPKDDDYRRLQDVALAFCSDVGLGLNTALYREAFATLAGNANRRVVPLASDGRRIGVHEMHVLGDDVGLAVTSLAELDDYRQHMTRLLQLTPLSGMAWINVRLGCVRLEHIRRARC